MGGLKVIMLTPAERDNLTRWDGWKKGFYEAYYVKLNDPLVGVALWLRFTILIPRPKCGRPEAAVWGIFFDSNGPVNNLALKDIFNPRECYFKRDFLCIKMGESFLFHNGTKGAIRRGHSIIEWDIHWRPKEDPHRIYPEIFYKLPIPSTKLVAPNESLLANGWFKVNGQQFSLEDAPAHQAHHWGVRYVPRWAWIHSNSFLEGHDTDVNLLTARVNKWLPPLTLLTLKASSGEYRFNKPICWFKNKCAYDLTSLKFEARDKRVWIKGLVSARKEDLLGVVYQDPDGSLRYCYNTEVADCVIELYKKEGREWRLLETLTADKTAAFETVDSSPSTLIPVWL